MDEAVLASRDFVNEGEFLPVVTSRMPVVSGLEESPPLLGYVATTAKPRAFTLLKIGPDGDPLLARWQVGLGTATSWTSDASTRWSKLWADWDGYVQFWSRVVRDTFPSLGDGTTAVIEDGMLRVHVETDAGDDGGYGSDATAVASITDPSFAGREIALSRVSPDTFAGELPVDEKGVYLVGTSVTAADGSTAQGAALVSQSYGREYEPGAPNGMLPRESGRCRFRADRHRAVHGFRHCRPGGGPLPRDARRLADDRRSPAVRCGGGLRPPHHGTGQSSCEQPVGGPWRSGWGGRTGGPQHGD